MINVEYFVSYYNYITIILRFLLRINKLLQKIYCIGIILTDNILYTQEK